MEFTMEPNMEETVLKLYITELEKLPEADAEEIASESLIWSTDIRDITSIRRMMDALMWSLSGFPHKDVITKTGMNLAEDRNLRVLIELTKEDDIYEKLFTRFASARRQDDDTAKNALCDFLLHCPNKLLDGGLFYHYVDSHYNRLRDMGLLRYNGGELAVRERDEMRRLQKPVSQPSFTSGFFNTQSRHATTAWRALLMATAQNHRPTVIKTCWTIPEFEKLYELLTTNLQTVKVGGRHRKIEWTEITTQFNKFFDHKIFPVGTMTAEATYYRGRDGGVAPEHCSTQVIAPSVAIDKKKHFKPRTTSAIRHKIVQFTSPKLANMLKKAKTTDRQRR